MMENTSLPALMTLAAEKHQRLMVHIDGDEIAGLNQSAIFIQQLLALNLNLSTQVIYCLSQQQAFEESKLSLLPQVQCINDTAQLNKVRHLLGTQSAALIINAYSGFNPNVLGISSGCVVGGGALILVTPKSCLWADYADPDYRRLRSGAENNKPILGHYIQRSRHILDSTPTVLRLTVKDSQWRNVAAQHHHIMSLPNKNEHLAEAFTIQDALVEDICKVMSGHNKRPLVIEADRGRGKSSALGIAAARLLFRQNLACKIVVTAPQISSVSAVFFHAHSELQRLSQRALALPERSLHWQQSCLVFMPLDAIALAAEPISLLLVDEAAAIPVSLLKKLSMHYSRLVFASTVYGYEGCGRGFSMRFMPFLEKQFRQVKYRKLTLAMRWSTHDSVEMCINELLLLDAERDAIIVDSNIAAAECSFFIMSQAQLLKNELQLQAVFSLLVSAHYQTSGDDLRLLLDHPDVVIAVLKHSENIVGVALVMMEGALVDEDQHVLLTQHRRFRGHVLAQQIFNEGFSKALSYRYARVVRIAVQPSLQRGGLGGLLLSKLQAYLSDENLADFIGASFAAQAQTVNFWMAQGFACVKLGSRCDPASGLLSISIIKPVGENISVNNECFFTALQQQWRDNLPYQLLAADAKPDVDLLPFILKGCVCDYKSQDLQQVYFYCQAQRSFDTVQASLYRMLLFFMHSGDAADWPEDLQKDKMALLDLLLLNMSWPVLIKKYAYSGRKSAEKNIKAVFVAFLKERHLSNKIDKNNNR